MDVNTVSPNMLAIIVMALVYMGIGWLWYSPKLFGDMIVCHTKTDKNNNVNVNMNQEKDKCCCWKSYAGEFIVALILGYVLSLFVNGLSSYTALSGLKIGFLAWLGFVATTMFSKVLWTCKPMVNFYISSGFYLVMMLLMGAVFSVWK